MEKYGMGKNMNRFNNCMIMKFSKYKEFYIVLKVLIKII